LPAPEIEAAMVLNFPLIVVPSVVAPAMMTTPMSAAIRAYSIAVRMRHKITASFPRFRGLMV